MNTSSSRQDPLGNVADELAGVVALRELADRHEDAAVEHAFREGWAWPQIAQALGVTRQAVHKKHLRRVATLGLARRKRNV